MPNCTFCSNCNGADKKGRTRPFGAGSSTCVTAGCLRIPGLRQEIFVGLERDLVIGLLVRLGRRELDSGIAHYQLSHRFAGVLALGADPGTGADPALQHHAAALGQVLSQLGPAVTPDGADHVVRLLGVAITFVDGDGEVSDQNGSTNIIRFKCYSSEITAAFKSIGFNFCFRAIRIYRIRRALVCQAKLLIRTYRVRLRTIFLGIIPYPTPAYIPPMRCGWLSCCFIAVSEDFSSSC